MSVNGIGGAAYLTGWKPERMRKQSKWEDDMVRKKETQETDTQETDTEANKKTDTKTDIVVKADGTRVLVVTTNMGGMETTTSLEISKPTLMQNESRNEGPKTTAEKAFSGGEQEWTSMQ